MHNNTGIVLKSYLPQQAKIALLTHEGVKKIYFCGQIPIQQGSVIQYQLDVRLATHIRALELVDLPLKLASQELLFFHQVLELVYYSLAEHMRVCDLYSLITQLYTLDLYQVTPVFKKLFLIKLCIYMDIYPDDALFLPYVPYIRHLSMQQLVQYVQDQTASIFDDWLRQCLMVHPYGEQFKTITLL